MSIGFATLARIPQEGAPRFPLILASHLEAWQQDKYGVHQGGATVEYRFEAFQGHFSFNDFPPSTITSMKSIDAGLQALPDGLKSAVSNLMISTMQYDLRGLCFVVGHMCGMLHSRQGVEYEDTCDIEFLTSSVTAMTSGDLLVALSPGVARQVLYVLALAGRVCGLSRLFVVADACNVAARPNNNQVWAQYLYCTAKFLLADAVANNYGAEHLLAFTRGYSTCVTLDVRT